MGLSGAVAKILAAQVQIQIKPSVIRQAARWLDENSAVADAITSLIAGGTGNAALSAAGLTLEWITSKITERDNPKHVQTPSPLSHLAIEKAPEVLGAYAVTERISGAEPGRNVREVDGKFQVVRSGRRIGLGLTRIDGVAHPIVLLTGSDSLPAWATRDLPAIPKSLVVGQAAAGLPSDGGKSAGLNVPRNQHRPGRSVAHHRYNAGSIGAYVNVHDEELDRDMLGFLSASHVLSEMGRASRKDRIQSPGFPDCARNGKFAYGTLADWSDLVHYTSATQPDLIVNDVDVALGYLDDNALPVKNDVPDPGDPSRKMLSVTGVMSLTELRDHTKQDVFLIGRTTSFATGTLEATDILEFPIKMPNARNYMFGGLALIQSSNPQRRFSQGGDSGALVYALKGDQCRAAGFIVGGSDTHSYMFPAALCLERMEASLV